MDTRRRNGMLLALVALGCLGGAALFGADLLEQSRSRSWPSVPGVIDRSGVKHSCGGRGGGAYAPDVEYSYAVNGRRFHGNRRRVYDRTCASREWARDFAAREYPVGTVVTVYFNPSDPSSAVLYPGETWTGTWLFTTLLVVIACVCAAGAYVSFRSFRVLFATRMNRPGS